MKLLIVYFFLADFLLLPISKTFSSNSSSSNLYSEKSVKFFTITPTVLIDFLVNFLCAVRTFI
jgi:hypothetical protein